MSKPKKDKINKHRNGDMRADGFIYFSGRWCSPKAKERIIAHQKKYKYENRDKLKQKNREWYEKNKDRHRKQNAAWRRANAEHYAQISKRSGYIYRKQNIEKFKECGRKAYYKRTPTAGLLNAISQFRSGAIGIDELNRRYDEALKRADDLISRAGKGKRKPIQHNPTG